MKPKQEQELPQQQHYSQLNHLDDYSFGEGVRVSHSVYVSLLK